MKLVLLALPAAVGLVFGAPEADEITTLPGWDGDLPSKQYSGYLDFGSKHLH